MQVRLKIVTQLLLYTLSRRLFQILFGGGDRVFTGRCKCHGRGARARVARDKTGPLDHWKRFKRTSKEKQKLCSLLASYKGPFSWCESRMGSRRKGLVHTVRACVRFSKESWNFLLSDFAQNGKSMRALKYQFSPASIANMDETPRWMNMPGAKTVEQVGAKSVPLKTTGQDKNRFTVAFKAFADGRKQPPYIIFKGVRPIAELSKFLELP